MPNDSTPSYATLRANANVRYQLAMAEGTIFALAELLEKERERTTLPDVARLIFTWSDQGSWLDLMGLESAAGDEDDSIELDEDCIAWDLDERSDYMWLSCASEETHNRSNRIVLLADKIDALVVARLALGTEPPTSMEQYNALVAGLSA